MSFTTRSEIQLIALFPGGTQGRQTELWSSQTDRQTALELSDRHSSEDLRQTDRHTALELSDRQRDTQLGALRQTQLWSSQADRQTVLELSDRQTVIVC